MIKLSECDKIILKAKSSPDLSYFQGTNYLKISTTNPAHTLIYTEHQKKLITSSERRSLKSMLSKLLIFGHK